MTAYGARRMLLENLNVVLVKTRFPENIGMAARACANMGCPEIRLADPERWHLDKAAPLATAKGLPILQSIRIFPALADALADSNIVFAATARVGGWRRALFPPWEAAEKIAAVLAAGGGASIVFGPEDRGLENSEIAHCQNIVHINTDGAASSLNLAQSVLIMLYECAKAMRGRKRAQQKPARLINASERERLEAQFKDILKMIDCLPEENADYFFIQWQNIFSRACLRGHEYDALMGFCRQLRNMLPKNREPKV